MSQDSSQTSAWRERAGFPGGRILPLLLPLLVDDLLRMQLVGAGQVGWYWGLYTLVEPVYLSLCLWLYSRQGWIDLRAFAFQRPGLGLDLLQATWPAMLCLMICRFLFLRVGGNLLLGGVQPPTVPLPQTEPGHALLVLYAALTAGIFQEIVFRGFITTRLKVLLRSGSAATTVSALLFAATAWSSGPLGMAERFVFALLMQGYYNAFRDMRRTILAHAFFDIWALW